MDNRAPAGDLLAADEPPPFEIVKAEGAAPLVLLCDHASNFVPRSLEGLGLDRAQLGRHIALDIGAAEVTRRLAQALDAPAVLSHFSRLVVDPNRDLDDPTLIPQISDGVVVPGNRDLGPAQRDARLRCFFRPYHEAVDRTIDAKTAAMAESERAPPRATARTGAKGPVLVSMHSFTPVMKGFERPWKIGILWNRDPRLPVPMMAKLRALDIPVGDNEPYSGKVNHGHTMHSHATPRGLANVLVEVRQDLIDTHHGADAWAGLLAQVLRELLADPGLYKVEHYE